MNYMFRNEPDKKLITHHIIKRLTSGSPNHEFQIDLNIAQGMGLKVKEMEDQLYNLSKMLVNICSLLKRQGEICKFYSDDRRIPFFEVFLPKDTKQLKITNAMPNDETTNNNELG